MGRQTLSFPTIFGIYLAVASINLYALDLKSALNESLNTNPEVQQKYQELSTAYHELDISRSGYLPKLDVRSSLAKERANTQMTGFESREFKTVNTNITLSQNLFSGFMSDSEMRVKRHNIQMKSHEYEEKVNDISLRLIKGYLDVLKAHELLEVERDNAKVHEKIYQKVTLRVEAGGGRIADHKEVLAKLSLSYVNTLTQDNNYNDAASVLHTLMGRYPDIKTLQKPSINSSLLPRTLEEAMADAVQKNASVMVGISEVESAKESVGVERSNYYPKVDAELNSRTYDNANGTGNIDKTAAAMVTLSYNLYNGGGDEARVKRGLSQTYNAMEHLRSLKRDVMEKMAIAYNAYTVFNRQKPFLDLYREANFDKTHFYHEEFDLGRRSLIDLLDSENEYSTARRKAIENEYDLLYSFFRVLAAKNELVTYFNIETDNQSATVSSDPIDSNREFAPSVGEYPMIPTIKMNTIESNVSINSVTNLSNQKGYDYYLKAARLGDKESQCKMVHLYEQGIGTAKNTEKALYWKKRCVQKQKGEHLLLPPLKAKSLDERLKELGILLEESQKGR
ncbi:MAG TPA: TolC family outer membrane protein [Sulfuricurvum sp.]|nr:TolC family outer membrane protein [Sulfuricurvum sp.]